MNCLAKLNSSESDTNLEIDFLIDIGTIDKGKFRVFSTHPLFEGAGFKCVDFKNSTIPIHSKDFAHIVYYNQYDFRGDQKKVYNVLKMILPFSMNIIQDHFIGILKSYFPSNFQSFVDCNDERILFYLQQAESFEEFNEKIMEKFNRNCDQHLETIFKSLQNKEYNVLYNYDSFNMEFITKLANMDILLELSLDFEIVKHIIDNLNECEKLLPYILKFSNVQILGYLIEKGVSIETKLLFDMTPIFYACSFRRYDMVKYLVENGANIESETERGNTVLNYACKCSTPEIIKYLIEKGANLFTMNRFNLLPVDTILNGEFPELVEYIRECMNAT